MNMITHLDRQALQAAGTTAHSHILVTVNQAWNIWNFRRSLIQALLDDGHRVTVLAPPDATVPKLERMGCAFIPLAMDNKGLNPLRDLALLYRMRAVFSLHQPCVILSYTIKNNIYGALAARSLRIPFLPNVSGLGTAFLSRGLLRQLAEGLYRAAFASVPAVFFQNGEDRALFIERRLVHEDQAQLLPGSGIDFERFAPTDYPPAEAPPVFLLIARLLRDKGVHEFVEAAGLVKQVHPEVRFQLLGAVDALNRTAIDRVTVADWEQSGAVEYLGTCEDVREHIALANCVVLPSYREGAPRTLIEAAAMARPLIATDVPGCRSVVENGVNGFLCEVRSGESLAQACLCFLALKREQQAALGKAGRTMMEREFCETRIIAAYRQSIAESLDLIRSQLEGVIA